MSGTAGVLSQNTIPIQSQVSKLLSLLVTVLHPHVMPSIPAACLQVDQGGAQFYASTQTVSCMAPDLLKTSNSCTTAKLQRSADSTGPPALLLVF